MIKVIHVQWRDSASLTGWKSMAKFWSSAKSDPVIVDSVGMMAYENEDKVVLLQTIGGEEVSGFFEIPRGCIKEIKVIGSLPMTIEEG
jgi:hypothetical protein